MPNVHFMYHSISLIGIHSKLNDVIHVSFNTILIRGTHKLLLYCKSQDRQWSVPSSFQLVGIVQLAIIAVVSILCKYIADSPKTFLYIFVANDNEAIIQCIFIPNSINVKGKT